MIDIANINKSEPYYLFIEYYNQAVSLNQNAIEAIAISSYDNSSDEVDSRFVNLKLINNEDWYFYSNYNSKKARDFLSHSQGSALFYWDVINVQIRIKASITKASKSLSDAHFKKREDHKNALAISSNQSAEIISHEKIVKNYISTLENKKKLANRPNYWGGYVFKPYYFEFWEGHDSRINKRNTFLKDGKNWKHSILQP